MSPRATGRVGAVLLPSALAWALGGCAAAQGSPEQTMEGFLQALGRQDTTRACEFWVAPGTTRPIRSSQEALDVCLERFEHDERWQFSDRQLAELQDAELQDAELQDAEITDVERDGDRVVIGPQDFADMDSVAAMPSFELVRVDDQWYLHRIADPSAPPP